MEDIEMETWQYIICVFAVPAFVLALCSSVKAVCRKILRMGVRDYDDQ